MRHMNYRVSSNICDAEEDHMRILESGQYLNSKSASCDISGRSHLLCAFLNRPPQLAIVELLLFWRAPEEFCSIWIN